VSGRARIVAAIVAKDLRALTRDRFYLIITVLGLVAYVAIFWVLPSTVDETIEIGVHQTGLDRFIDQLGDGQGLTVTSFGSADALRAAVERGDEVTVGVSFPPEFLDRVRAGEPTTVTVYLGGEVPDAVRAVVAGSVRELAFLAAGELPPVTLPAERVVVLGEDRVGNQISVRERARPLFAFFVLVVETMALAALVASEIQARTASAVLVTPAKVSDLLVAKGILGTLLAFGESLVLMAAIAGLSSYPGTVLLLLALGAILVTGFGLLAGSSGADFVGIVFWTMAFMIPLAVPAIGVLFPGSATGWVKALPSWGLVDGLLRVSAYGEGIGSLGTQLVALAVWCVVAFVAGWIVLKRRVVRL